VFQSTIPVFQFFSSKQFLFLSQLTALSFRSDFLITLQMQFRHYELKVRLPLNTGFLTLRQVDEHFTCQFGICQVDQIYFPKEFL
jgi:hypothetical protein